MSFFKYTLIFLLGLSSCKPSTVNSLSIQWSDSLMLPGIDSGKVNPGLAGALSGIFHDYLIIAGGANFPDKLPWEGGKKVYHDNAYVFHFQNQKWQFKGIFHLNKTVAYGAAVSVEDGIVCLGGENAEGISSDVFLMKFDSAKQQIITTPIISLPIPLTNLSAVAIKNKIYIAGGESTDNVSPRFFVLDYENTNPDWQELSPLPKGISNSVMVTSDDRIFLIGGRSKQSSGISELYHSVLAYDIQKNKWSEEDPLPYALSAGTGISLNESHILLFGGDKGATFHKTEVLIGRINNEKDSSVRLALIDEKNKLQESHPGFSRDVLMYDIPGNEWKSVGKIPFATPVTTIAIKYKDEIIIPSGEIRAGVRTPHILIGKIKSD